MENSQMRSQQNSLKNESGSAIVFTLMVLVILTVVGIAATNRSSTELNVVTEQLKYYRNFNLAEGAATEAADLLEGIAAPETDPPDWLESVRLAMTETNMNAYLSKTSGSGAPFPQAATVEPATTLFMGSYEGVAAGFSLDMSRSTVHSFGLYGRSQNEGTTTIKLGYRKAFQR
jgi:Tfp pilus assembly protein PilX